MGRIVKIRISIEELTEDERAKLKQMQGKYLVVIDDDPCLTCGHKKRLQYIHRTDGKRELVKECLYCLCEYCRLRANREGP